jgi:hypothetical protein
MFGLTKKNDDRNCGKNLIHFLSKNAQLTRDKIKILFGLAENVHKNEKKLSYNFYASEGRLRRVEDLLPKHNSKIL